MSSLISVSNKDIEFIMLRERIRESILLVFGLPQFVLDTTKKSISFDKRARMLVTPEKE